MKKDTKKIIAMVLCFAVCIFACCMFIGFLAEHGFNNINLINVIVILAVFYLSGVVNIVLHEVGHLVGGLISGYEFVLIRFGSFMLIKENGKFCRKKFSLMGTGGQCIMSPPSFEEAGNQPFLLYHLGGAAVNFILGVIGILMAFLVPKGIAATGFGVFAFVSFAMWFINAIPINTCNDGHNAMDISKSKRTQKLMGILMYLSAQSTKGTSIEDMPIKSLELDTIEPQNSLEINTVMLEISYDMACGNFEKADKICDKLLGCEKIIPLLENEIKCCKLICIVMNGGTEEQFKSVYTEELKKYIKQFSKYILSDAVTKITCELYNGEMENAKKSIEDFDKMCENYFTKGQIIDNKKLLKYIMEKFNVEVKN